MLKGDFHFTDKKPLLKELGPLAANQMAILLIKGPLLLVISSIVELPANKLVEVFCEKRKTKGGGSPSIAQTTTRDPSFDLELLLEIIRKKLTANSL